MIYGIGAPLYQVDFGEARFAIVSGNHVVWARKEDRPTSPLLANTREGAEHWLERVRPGIPDAEIFERRYMPNPED